VEVTKSDERWAVLLDEMRDDLRNSEGFMRTKKTKRERQHWSYVVMVLRSVLKDCASIQKRGVPRFTRTPRKSDYVR
jgi:hypothetical protein